MGFLLVLFLCIWWFLNASFLLIRDVEVSGNNVVPASSIEAAALHDTLGKYIGLFSKADIFFYPKDQITRDLLALYPTLKTVRVGAKDFHTIQIEVTERSPYALWCFADDAHCVLLDADGLAYANAPEYSGQVYTTYVSGQRGNTLPQQFLTPEKFHTLAALVDAFSKKLGSDHVREVGVDENEDVHLKISSGYELILPLDADTGTIFNNFSLALTSAPFSSHPLSDFQYIDLRFGDKVYYKLKNE